MNIELNPNLLDVVEIPKKFLGDETPGTTLGTVVEVFGNPPSSLLVEIADQGGVPQHLVEVPASEAGKVWSAPQREEGAAESVAGVRFQKGILLLQNGLVGEAIADLRAAFEADPRLAGTLMNLASDLAQRGGYDSAIFLYELIVELQPENQLNRRNLLAAHINRGVWHARHGALEKAIDDFSVPLMLEAPEDLAQRARHDLVATYTQWGIRLSGINRFREALANFATSLQIQPSQVTRKNLAIGLVSWQASRVEGKQTPSAAAFKQPMRMGLSLSECLNAYGATVANLGDVDSAQRILQAAIQADPANELAHANLTSVEASRRSAVPAHLDFGITAIEPEPAQAAAA